MSPRRARSHLSIYTFFHVCAKGNNGEDVFLNENDFLHYLSLLEKYRKRKEFHCFAYCLMDNHIHLLLRVTSLRQLSKAMHGLQLAHVIYFNRKYGRKGHLFQDRFSSWVIKDHQHLLEVKQYIENNPVKAEMCRKADQYRWSSANGDSSVVTISRING